MLSNSPKLNISFVILLILLSAVSASNQATAISVGGIVAGLKDAVDLFPGLVSAASQLGQIAGIAPKESPAPSSSDADYKQLRQELETKFNTLSAQLDALNEQDKQLAKVQLARTFNERLNHYSAPEQSFIVNTTRQLAPQDVWNVVEPRIYSLLCAQSNPHCLLGKESITAMRQG